MFEGFDSRDIATRTTSIHAVVGGSGPPLLLLHGYPQTHVIWHKIAPALAERFTVVATDLRGYGDSGKPRSDTAHAVYSKRAMAEDQVEVMQTLGFARFAVAATTAAAGSRTAWRSIIRTRWAGSRCSTSCRRTRSSPPSIRGWQPATITGSS